MASRTEEEIMDNWCGERIAPLVSVCCTTYNHEEFIAQAIEGFLMQETDFPFEVIIRDDCSTDSTASIVMEYVERFPNIIKPIFEAENQYSKGVKPMPVVFKKAVGEYFALCEGDDFWTDTHKLEKQLIVFKRWENTMICFHSAEELDEETENKKVICKYFSHGMEIGIKDVIAGRGGYMPTASIMLKNVHIDEMIAALKGAPIGDYFMQVYMGSLGEVRFLSDTMCVYRRNANGSWTHRQKEKSNRKAYRLKMVVAIDKFSQYFESIELKNNLYLALRFYALSYIREARGYRKIIAIYEVINSLNNYSTFRWIQYEFYMACKLGGGFEL